MPRKDMASREPIVKAELEPGQWTELPRTSDVTLDGFRVSIHARAIPLPSHVGTRGIISSFIVFSLSQLKLLRARVQVHSAVSLL